jgi:hypothetical protein
MKYLKESSLIRKYKADLQDVRNHYIAYQNALMKLDEYHPKMYKMLETLLNAIPREGEIKDWIIHEYNWTDIEINSRGMEEFKCFYKDEKENKWYYSTEHVNLISDLNKKGYTTNSIKRIDSNMLIPLDTLSTNSIYKLIEKIQKTPKLIGYYVNQAFYKMNESVGVQKMLDQYFNEYINVNKKYRPKFVKLLIYILDKCGLDFINDLLIDGPLEYERYDIKVEDGTLAYFSKVGNTYFIEYYIDSNMDNIDSISINDPGIETYELYDILNLIINTDKVVLRLNRNPFLKMNEEFTDRYRTNGYMISDKNAEKIADMLCRVLDKIHNTEIYQDIIDELRELYIGDGVMFSNFTFHFSDKIWYIDTVESEYNDNSDWIRDIYETYPIKDYDRKEIASVLDLIMSKPEVLNILNRDAFKKMNENKWVKTFELFSLTGDSLSF